MKGKSTQIILKSVVACFLLFNVGLFSFYCCFHVVYCIISHYFGVVALDFYQNLKKYSHF